MRFGAWVFAGILLGAGASPLADATVLYPEETAAMREAWIRATSGLAWTDRAHREPNGSRPSFAPPHTRDAFFYRRISGAPPC
jgi:hypothetical protein